MKSSNLNTYLNFIRPKHNSTKARILVLALILSIVTVISSCQKDSSKVVTTNDTLVVTSYVTQFIGSWKVFESVDQSSLTQWHIGRDTFYAKTIKTSDTSFGFVQSLRRPIPKWVGTGKFSSDTLYVKPEIVGRKLITVPQGELGTYSDNSDTLQIRYVHPGPLVSSPFGPNGSVYWVSQRWIRQ